MKKFDKISDDARIGNFSAVKAKLESDPNLVTHDALIEACLGGHTDIVELLLQYPQTDLAHRDYYAFIMACHKKRVGVINLLMPLLDAPLSVIEYASGLNHESKSYITLSQNLDNSTKTSKIYKI